MKAGNGLRREYTIRWRHKNLTTGSPNPVWVCDIASQWEFCSQSVDFYLPITLDFLLVSPKGNDKSIKRGSGFLFCEWSRGCLATLGSEHWEYSQQPTGTWTRHTERCLYVTQFCPLIQWDNSWGAQGRGARRRSKGSVIGFEKGIQVQVIYWGIGQEREAGTRASNT